MSRKPGDTIKKDPNSTETKGMDWTAYLNALGVTISTSSWTQDGPDALLVLSSPNILSGNLKTQIWMTGGTVGATYRLTNRITTTGSPATIDDRSFNILVQEQ